MTPVPGIINVPVGSDRDLYPIDTRVFGATRSLE